MFLMRVCLEDTVFRDERDIIMEKPIREGEMDIGFHLQKVLSREAKNRFAKYKLVFRYRKDLVFFTLPLLLYTIRNMPYLKL